MLMVKKIVCTLAVAVASALALSGPAAAQNQKPPFTPVLTNQPQAGRQLPGPEEPCIANNCLFYAGDFDSSGPNPNGLLNGIDTFFGLQLDGTVWVPVNVPKKGKTVWNVTGLFVNTLDLQDPTATSTTANWSIVQGVAGEHPLSTATVICSGTNAPMTTTPTGRTFLFGVGNVATEYTDVVLGITGCPALAAGEYWITVVPIDTTNPNGFQETFLSDVEDNTPQNFVGPGSEPADMSYFTSEFLSIPSFTPAAAFCTGEGSIINNVANVCDRFSVGVIGTTDK
jgi:hypothetical protein